jgi:hypothetical protein
MIKSYWRYVLGGICLLGILLALPSLPGWARRTVTLDYRVMVEEFQTAGGIKFFSKTEELLRLADFEQALMRYRFLKGQVLGLTGYRPLVVNIDRRLRFLQKQMRLADADIQPLPRLRVSRLVRPQLPKKESRKAPQSQPSEGPHKGAKGSGTTKPLDQQYPQTRTLPALPKTQPPGQSNAIPTTSEPKKAIPSGISSPDSGKSPLPSDSQATSPVPSTEAPIVEKAPASPEGKSKTKVPPPPKKSFLGWLKTFFPGK